eukprot:TRINITY_DN9947_c0_g1_i1.p1 TRINITY_DN9947_c0_g1~~TRINITY_DN9947_c0_g1_i1.p1  ORF type:complete len:623 (-),score=152.59 TRINITY_DN9947_c0_g1_i1:166-2034(-)
MQPRTYTTSAYGASPYPAMPTSRTMPMASTAAAPLRLASSFAATPQAFTSSSSFVAKPSYTTMPSTAMPQTASMRMAPTVMQAAKPAAATYAPSTVVSGSTISGSVVQATSLTSKPAQQPSYIMAATPAQYSRPAVTTAAPAPVTYMAATPAIASRPTIETLASARPATTVLGSYPYLQSPSSYAIQPATTVSPAPVYASNITTAPVVVQKAGAGKPVKLHVNIIQATGLKHLNHFTGDNLWVECVVKGANGHPTGQKCDTQTVPGTLDPVWNETHELSWNVGQDLEFKVYDKGLIGSKTEGKAVLKSSEFYPDGLDVDLPLSGCKDAVLHLRVVPADLPAEVVEQPVKVVQAAVLKPAVTQPAVLKPAVVEPSPVSVVQVQPVVEVAQPVVQQVVEVAQPVQVLESAEVVQQPDVQEIVQPVGVEQPLESEQAPPMKVQVSIIQANGLANLGWVGSGPWVQCEVQRANPMEPGQVCRTEPQLSTVAPLWNETHELEWAIGDHLEFCVFDKEDISTKEEGKAIVVVSDQFYPNGIEGDFPIDGKDEVTLTLRIVPMLAEGAFPDNQQLPETAAQATVKQTVGDWLICEDAQGEFYQHVPTQQTFDQAPQELLDLLAQGEQPQ